MGLALFIYLLLIFGIGEYIYLFYPCFYILEMAPIIILPQLPGQLAACVGIFPILHVNQWILGGLRVLIHLSNDCASNITCVGAPCCSSTDDAVLAETIFTLMR